MEEKRTLRILFIGNSHTYFNDMPAMVAEKARKAGFDCEVTMIAHGGWYLEQHVQEPDVRFNILYGHYDYVVLQEFSHPFGPEEKFFGAVRTLNQWIREAKSKPVIYMTWARKEEQKRERLVLTSENILQIINRYTYIFMKKLRISKIWIAMIVIIIVAVAAWLFSGSKNEEQIDFKQEAVTTQTLQNSVTATSTIEAVTSVTVGTQVSGIVNKLYISDTLL